MYFIYAISINNNKLYQISGQNLMSVKRLRFLLVINEP